MTICSLILSFILITPLFAAEQAQKQMTIAELVTYKGKDREQVLYAGAKAEGKVTWYTSLAGDSYKGMIKAFETKYAGVKVESYRANGGEITNRIFEEAKARRPIVDTIESTEANLMVQRDAFLLRPYHSPYFAAYPADAKQEGERGLYYWATARESYIGFAYNKNLLPKDAVPKKVRRPAPSGAQRTNGFDTGRHQHQSDRRDSQNQGSRNAEKAQGPRHQPAHDHSAGFARYHRVGRTACGRRDLP
jgi:ABC-type glycerol-3-phosphate transport system substrate-binding protein